jgi:hypothetical protein
MSMIDVQLVHFDGLVELCGALDPTDPQAQGGELSCELKSRAGDFFWLLHLALDPTVIDHPRAFLFLSGGTIPEAH